MIILGIVGYCYFAAGIVKYISAHGWQEVPKIQDGIVSMGREPTHAMLPTGLHFTAQCEKKQCHLQLQEFFLSADNFSL